MLEDLSTASSSKLIAFPGGGLYFWWQAGYVQFLQQTPKCFENSLLSGASAGSLTAVLAACGVDMDQAYESAYKICEERNVWTQPLGLMGCWGETRYACSPVARCMRASTQQTHGHTDAPKCV